MNKLTDNENIVLIATRMYKSSYAGIKNYRYHEANNNTQINIDDYNEAKLSLIDKRLLNKAGAITKLGKSIVSSAQLHQTSYYNPKPF